MWIVTTEGYGQQYATSKRSQALALVEALTGEAIIGIDSSWIDGKTFWVKAKNPIRVTIFEALPGTVLEYDEAEQLRDEVELRKKTEEKDKEA